MKRTKSLAYDLGYVQAAVEMLERYLISDEVFWPLGESPPAGGPDYPRLTLDGLLLAEERMLARAKAAGQQEQVDRVLSDLEVIHTRRRVAWEEKAGQCYRVRLRMWGNYLQEYQDNPGENADRYAYEVRLRVMLALLQTEISTPEVAQAQLLDSLDGYLQKVLVQTGFIWEAELQSEFPLEKYWYLYGKLPSRV